MEIMHSTDFILGSPQHSVILIKFFTAISAQGYIATKNLFSSFHFTKFDLKAFYEKV